MKCLLHVGHFEKEKNATDFFVTVWIFNSLESEKEDVHSQIYSLHEQNKHKNETLTYF